MKIILYTFVLLLSMMLAACQPIQPVQPVAAAAEATAPAQEEAAPVAELAGNFGVVQLIVDFDPGAWTPSHTHGGMLMVTVRNGALTVRDEQGVETVYHPGDSFIEIPGVFLEIGNASEEVVSVATVALLPSGEKLTTTKEGISTNDAPPGPTVFYNHTQTVTVPIGEFALHHLILDFEPGAWTPSHTHGGMLVVMLMDGELTVRDEQGTEQIYKAGEAFIEEPGIYFEIGNAGDSVASVAVAGLIPMGEKLTTIKEGISTDNAPPGPTLLYQGELAGNSVAAP